MLTTFGQNVTMPVYVAKMVTDFLIFFNYESKQKICTKVFISSDFATGKRTMQYILKYLTRIDFTPEASTPQCKA